MTSNTCKSCEKEFHFCGLANCDSCKNGYCAECWDMGADMGDETLNETTQGLLSRAESIGIELMGQDRFFNYWDDFHPRLNKDSERNEALRFYCEVLMMVEAEELGVEPS